jgi:D-amino-acid oxidase
LRKKDVPKHELPVGVVEGIEFQSVCINTAIYLPYLASACLKNGVVIKRAIFDHISDAARPGVHHSGQGAKLVVNCTGLSSHKLGGVADSKLTPARGQIVVVRQDAGAMYSISGTDDASDEMSYIMTRAAGGGTILGGCLQEGNWESQPDPNLAVRIMERAVKMCPDLTGGKGIEHLSIIRHGVGLRPLRHGGARLEAETISGVEVVHLYGHAGSGYQSSYGSCQEAVELVEKTLKTRARL